MTQPQVGPAPSLEAAFFTDYQPYPEIPAGVERDGHGRPQLVLPGGTVRYSFTRASALAEHIGVGFGLHRWQQRLLTRGLGVREDLAALAASLPAKGVSKEEDDRINAELDRIAKEAMEHAGRDVDANYGTAIHNFVEHGDFTNAPERMQADLASFALERKDLTVLMPKGVFCACPTLRVAGTFDQLVQVPGASKATVDDVKTGKAKIHAFAIQLAIYANSLPYDIETDTYGEWPWPIDKTWAIYTHIPRGEGKTKMYWINIELGWEAAKQAAYARDYQSLNFSELCIPIDPAEFIAQRRHQLRKDLAWADSRETINQMWMQNTDIWTDSETTIGNSRITELEGPTP